VKTQGLPGFAAIIPSSVVLVVPLVLFSGELHPAPAA
jgi:hypothetical protein